MNKDFENFELRLIKLKEESHEDFEKAEKIFQERYESKLDEIFPRDILGAKSAIAGRFIIGSVDNPENKDIFKAAVQDTIKTLPLSSERRESLVKNILKTSDLTEYLQSFFEKKDTISRDPFFALVEDFSMDGNISKEEFILLQQSYEQQGDFLKALESLPTNIKDLFHAHIHMTLSQEHRDKKNQFESEFASELKSLNDKGYNIEPVVVFVSRSYYKTPGKFKKYEHPKRRMRRTFKIALLRLLRTKLGNIDAKIMLEKFESGENFEDMFMLLFKLMEIVNENPEGKEIFTLLNLDEDIQDEVFTAEENTEKILAGDSLVMSIASLFSRGDAKKEEQELEDGILEKILDESTDIVGEDVYFNREDENAGIYAQGVDDELEEDEEIDYDTMSPETAYEMLKHEFHKIEKEKRQAFLEGRYEDIDFYNDRLLSVQSKLEKLSKLLALDN